MQRAVIYCRVSSAEQVDNTSLQTQEAACRDWCSRNDLEVSAVYVDRGESAKTADRPEFLRMVSDCQKMRTASRVVVYRLDRFARNTLDHGIYAQRLKQAGVMLASVTENLTDDPSGNFVQNIYAAVAQFDNDVRSTRAKDAMKAIRAKGGWVHKAPFGFKIVRRENIPFLEPDEDSQALIQRAFSLVIEHRNIEHVYEILRPPISRTVFYRTFKDKLYSRIKGFMEVQQVMTKTKLRSRRSDDFPLRGTFICGVCATPLTASMAKGKYAYYHCQCAGHASISSKAVDLAIREMLSDLSGAFYIAIPSIRACLELQANQLRNDTETVISTINNKLDGLTQQLDRLVDAMLQGRLPDGQYDRRRVEIESSIAATIKERENAEQEKACSNKWLDMADDLLVDLPTIWNTIKPVNRPKIVAQMFPNGIIIRGKTVQTSVRDSIFGTLCASDGTFFRLAPPTGFEPVLLG